ncbi:uncharacterized protein LOC117193920 [Drosophila miranda]|uniref:uncharacterized protein LOC117193919 n=1 Tax=Drosophila miranda TaxID=7229 RepID=UPI00143F6C02|nr:uncharacterized protein LOC117193919 [Drosophila miranda]XP_033254479.1 uncharacterized protein LOC117193920 [Drosophila miranda]
MGLDRSPGKEAQGAGEGVSLVCALCQKAILTTDEVFRSVCEHEFHLPFDSVQGNAHPDGSPQANASERVNRSVIAGIRAYIRPDQKNWDECLNRIACALRSARHASVGTTPYYLAFGQHMITSGSTYSLLRKLNMLEDRSLVFDKQDSFEIVRQSAGKQMQRSHNLNEKRYNLRSSEVAFAVGQEVFRRNFKQSCFQSGYSAKFGPAFVKARVRRKIGNSYYELEDLQGRLLGNYHAKDIRQ